MFQAMFNLKRCSFKMETPPRFIYSIDAIIIMFAVYVYSKILLQITLIWNYYIMHVYL